jgi:hypothetical protein
MHFPNYLNFLLLSTKRTLGNSCPLIIAVQQGILVVENLFKERKPWIELERRRDIWPRYWFP